MNNSVVYNPMNGRLTAVGKFSHLSYEDAKSQLGSNHWCCTENNRNNGRNVNFNNGNTNNNNKYNSNVARPVAAFLDYVPADFIASVWEAYDECLRGKRRSNGAVEYMLTAAADIPKLAKELWTGTYRPGTSTCFLVKYPKWREVFAAGFRDRIVHHWICLRLEPLFEERFVQQGNLSFNCRKGYGTIKAVDHVAEGMRIISDNYHKQAWVFRGDLVGFFMSINKELLWYLLERFISRRYHGDNKELLIRVTKLIVMHHPERDCIFNSPIHHWRHLSQNKSLFTSETGEPIGNLTTQLFANFLMSFFVAQVKYIFRRKNFCMAQFVDDFVLVCDDKRFLIDSIPRIEKFLSEKLRLKLHKDKRYLQPVSHGLMFVGSYIKPGRRFLSNRTKARMKERCNGYRKLLNSMPTDANLEHIEQVLNSYLGFTRNHKTYNFRRDCIDSIGDMFWKYFYVKGHYESIRLKQQYKLIIN